MAVYKRYTGTLLVDNVETWKNIKPFNKTSGNANVAGTHNIYIYSRNLTRLYIINHEQLLVLSLGISSCSRVFSSGQRSEGWPGYPDRRQYKMGISLHRGFCGCCVRAAKWLPVLFISGIVAWSYYAFVVHLCILTVINIDGFAVLLLLIVPYHLFFVLFLWAYFKTVFTSPGNVPKRFRLTESEVDRIEGASDPKYALEQLAIAKDLPVFMRSLQGEVRYCSECSHIKPDRTHHCSVCNSCILKMDHHCPWVNNCVGFNNYKFFVLFLAYAVVYCMYVALSTLKYFLLFWSIESTHTYGK